LREDRLRDLTAMRVPEKSQKVSNFHRKDMLPLTQGLNYRSACDMAHHAVEDVCKK